MCESYAGEVREAHRLRRIQIKQGILWYVMISSVWSFEGGRLHISVVGTRTGRDGKECQRRASLKMTF